MPKETWKGMDGICYIAELEITIWWHNVVSKTSNLLRIKMVSTSANSPLKNADSDERIS
jgi:hypothetical protein